MSFPVARLGDESSFDPCGAPPRSNIKGSGDVFVNGMPVHRLSDNWAPHACPFSPPHSVPDKSDAYTVSGSGSVFINGLPCARLSDAISCGSVIAQGSGNVFAG